MEKFKAGDKAIYQKNQVVTVLQNGGTFIRQHDGTGTVLSNPLKYLTECFTVRILDNGMAKEVNPLPIPDGDTPFCTEFQAWEQAELKCRTLPCKLVNDTDLVDGVFFFPEPHELRNESETWCAYLENETFILVSPL